MYSVVVSVSLTAVSFEVYGVRAEVDLYVMFGSLTTLDDYD